MRITIAAIRAHLAAAPASPAPCATPRRATAPAGPLATPDDARAAVGLLEALRAKRGGA